MDEGPGSAALFIKLKNLGTLTRVLLVGDRFKYPFLFQSTMRRRQATKLAVLGWVGAALFPKDLLAEEPMGPPEPRKPRTLVSIPDPNTELNETIAGKVRKLAQHVCDQTEKKGWVEYGKPDDDSSIMAIIGTHGKIYRILLTYDMNKEGDDPRPDKISIGIGPHESFPAVGVIFHDVGLDGHVNNITGKVSLPKTPGLGTEETFQAKQDYVYHQNVEVLLALYENRDTDFSWIPPLS